VIGRPLAAALLALGAGCAGAAAPPRAAPPSAPEAAKNAPKPETPPNDAPKAPARRAKLHFELGGRPFPLPLVRGTIAGHETWMLVDTGATSHAIATWFAQRHGLPLATIAGSGTDHAGRSVRMFRTEGALVSIEGWGGLGPGARLVFDMPEVIERLGIGMFLSPQMLPEDGRAAVLDLAAGELRLEHAESARAALAARGAKLPDARVCVETGAITGLSFVVPASVSGHAAQLLVDTGAEHTDVLEVSNAGKALAGRSEEKKEKLFGASGGIKSRIVTGARLSIGDFSSSADVSLIPGKAEASCARDGVVGMDVLRGCTLVFETERVHGACKAQ
jgi:predicted aspartyl protease